jgi:hypothetical protein
MSHVRAFRLPPMIAPTAQLEKKFKHAIALGVTTKRSAAGFRDFRAALEEFVEEPGTVRLTALYHRDLAVLNVNPVTRTCVVQRLDGEFWTAERLTDGQYMHVITKGSLGGSAG